MHLNPYGEYAVLLAASLVNEPPESRSDIVARTREFGMTMTFTEGADDLDGVQLVLREWLRVVDAEDPHVRAQILNEQMEAATAIPRLTDHDGEGWHLHYRDDSRTTLPRVLAAVISVGTALHLTT